MNKEKIERWILLRQSGELGRWRTRRLERALARNPEMHAFEADLIKLTDATRAWSLPSGAAHSAQAIHARLAAPPDRREVIMIHPVTRRFRWPALAAAAALAAFVLVMWWPSRKETPIAQKTGGEPPAVAMAPAWDDGVDAELDALRELVYDTGADTTARVAPSSADEEQLIRELLALEGITI